MRGDELEISKDPSKYVTLPVQNEAIWRKYQTTLDTFWTVYEVNIERDRQSFIETLTDEAQRKYLLKVIAFMLIAHSTIVTKELFLDLINHVDIKEASYYFGSQADSKKTHSMMYSLLLDELIEADAKEEDDVNLAERKAQLMSEVASIPEVRNLLRWYVENVNLERESFAKRMFAFATLQGVTFMVPFMLFSWLEKQHPSKLTGLMKSNNLIWRDEKLNLSFSCMLFDYIEDEVGPETAANIVMSTVGLAKDLFTKALPVSILGIDCELMTQYIEHSADMILAETNNEKVYKIEKTPFDWILEPKYEGPKQVDIPVLSTSNDSMVAQASFELDEDF